jgi:hypothetical protein
MVTSALFWAREGGSELASEVSVGHAALAEAARRSREFSGLAEESTREPEADSTMTQVTCRERVPSRTIRSLWIYERSWCARTRTPLNC